VYVPAIGMQVDDGIADDLAGPVVGDVAAPAGFGDLDAARLERLRRDQDVRTPAIPLHA
jgi:hypothetical protein